eukprot:1193861-Rhodomonas_salina.1
MLRPRPQRHHPPRVHPKLRHPPRLPPRSSGKKGDQVRRPAWRPPPPQPLDRLHPLTFAVGYLGSINELNFHGLLTRMQVPAEALAKISQATATMEALGKMRRARRFATGKPALQNEARAAGT